MILTSHFITLDGVAHFPERWHPAFASPEQYDVLRENMGRLDGQFLGRRTYDEFAAFWPHQGDEVPTSPETNRIRKFVLSRRTDADWQPAEVIGDEPVEAARALNERGLTVGVYGSSTLTRALLAADLVDEMQFYLDPVIVGTGGRLFDGDHGQSRLALVSSTSLPNGVLHLVYRPAPRRRTSSA